MLFLYDCLKLTRITKVYFIGAGPGAVDLITIRGYKVLSLANVVLYDALVSNDILNICSPNTVKISVGKRKGEKYITQRMVNEYLVFYAYKYNFVVRLKCGDPMIFSRIDEELYILKYYSIFYEIIPGITAALAAASSVRKPLTRRGISSSISLFTSNLSQGFYRGFYNIENNGTLIQYMGGKYIKKTVKKLLSIGYSKLTPVIIIINCSYFNEYILHFKLGNLKKNINNYNGPILIMIGESLLNY